MRKFLLILLLSLCSFVSSNDSIRLKGHYTCRRVDVGGFLRSYSIDDLPPFSIDLDYWDKDGVLIIRNTDTIKLINGRQDFEDPERNLYHLDGIYKKEQILIRLEYYNNNLIELELTRLKDFTTVNLILPEEHSL